MSADLIFEEPPASRRGRGPTAGNSPFGRWLAALRDHPGQWAKYPEPMSLSMTTLVKRGMRWGIAPGEYDATMRGATNGAKGTLYVRYIGAPATEAKP